MEFSQILACISDISWCSRKFKKFQYRAYFVLCQYSSTAFIPAGHVTAYAVIIVTVVYKPFQSGALHSWAARCHSARSWLTPAAEQPKSPTVVAVVVWLAFVGIRWAAWNFVLLSRSFTINHSSSLYCIWSKDSTHYPNRVNRVHNKNSCNVPNTLFFWFSSFNYHVFMILLLTRDSLFY